jgi:POT family proton-dependent oligopeptide transporter
VNNPVLSLPYYADIISKIGIGSVGIGVILICFVPVIRKWMGGVH